LNDRPPSTATFPQYPEFEPSRVDTETPPVAGNVRFRNPQSIQIFVMRLKVLFPHYDSFASLETCGSMLV
jgi:hypothetical protein